MPNKAETSCPSLTRKNGSLNKFKLSKNTRNYH